MSIKLRIVLLIGFFMGLMVLNSFVINVWIVGAQDAGAVINIAGRQRMLSQKMAKEVAMREAGVQRNVDLSQTQRLFENSLNALIKGDNSIGIDAAGSDEAQTRLRALQPNWNEFKALLSAIESNSSKEDLGRLNDLSLSVLKGSHSVVESLEQDFNAAMVKLRWVVNIFAFLAIAAAVAGYAFLHHFVIARILSIHRLSGQVVEEKDLSKRLRIEGKDEITATASAFNHMLSSFVDMNRATREVESELQQQLEMLSIVTHENRQSMDLQRGETIQVSSAVTEMASTIQEVARNTQEASEVACRAKGEAQQGSALLESSMALTHSLAEEVRGASGNIEQLAQASDSIGGIANTISTIAEQTNLLALNAAIEAARAGEQGRGFAVVADEVRTLAQRTQDATGEIHKLIATLHESTHASVRTMQLSKERSEQGVVQAEEMAQALKKIIHSVENLNDINHQIAVAAEEQSAVADEINKNVVNIESKAENTFANAEVTTTYTANLAQMAERLRAKLNEYRIE